MHRLIIAFFVTTATFGMPVASVASTPQVFAAPQEQGKIERLDLQSGELVIDDTLFRLSGTVAVYNYRGFQTSVDALRKGMRVAYNVAEDAAGIQSVAVIWILSKK
jgi:uncharacterized protein (AIM24 family)